MERLTSADLRRSTAVAAVLVAGLGITAVARQLVRDDNPAAGSRALAVLVFRHSAQADLEPLALHVTSSLIGALGDVAAIDVRSLEAVWPYRGGATTHDVVARRLGVGWIVGGHVFRSADSLIATAELTDAATGRFRGQSRASVLRGDEASLVDSVVARVGSMLRDRISEQVRIDSWKAGTRNIEAINESQPSVQDESGCSVSDRCG